MAKKATAGNGKVSTSKLIRDWLKTNRKATVPEIIAAFRAQGIDVSTSLASKIRYSKGRKATSGRAAKVAASSGSAAKDKSKAKPERGEKAAAIRAVWHEMGRKARPKDVIAKLVPTGMKITSSEVIDVRDRMFRHSRKAAAGNAVALVTANAAPVAGGLTLERLLAAKAVAAKLGGIEAAYESFRALAKLEG